MIGSSPSVSQTPECGCGGTGYKMEGQLAVPCPCGIERKIATLLPQRYRQAQLGDLPTDVVSFVTRWLDLVTDGLFITGPVGTGKTYLAAAILRNLMEKRRKVTWRRCAQFFTDIRETYRANTSEDSVLKPLEQAGFLILDDLGAGSLSDHERRFTLELLDRRLNASRPTIITTNWSLAQIAERMDDRIASRLATFTGLELSGDDRRLRQL